MSQEDGTSPGAGAMERPAPAVQGWFMRAGGGWSSY